jgi:helicase MOV-10
MALSYSHTLCFSRRYGFNISMMERIMKLDRYKFSEKTGYNQNFIVQLTDNFRSHMSIIRYSNKEFYNSQLVSCQKPEIANFAIGWKHLPNKDYPVIFQASWRKSEEDGTTLFNYGDLAFTRIYVGRLLVEGINGKKVEPKDIGIISPYSGQREKLKGVFTNGIEIGTVEYFQGREKLIIILSCVRSKTKTIGFLKNEKRLNVALTRAKALLIVIGNPETLGQNKYWRKFITLCHLKNAVVGNVPSWVIKRTKKELKFDEDKDEDIRFEELVNAMMIDV